jgi:uncharacterized delta-60 repeat protein
MKNAHLTLLCLASLLAATPACESSSGGGGTLTPDGGSGVASIGLVADPPNLTLDPGGKATITITVAGANGSVADLSAEGLPLGVSAVFDPPQTAATTKLTISVAKDLGPGVYPITVRARLGAVSASATLGVSVSAPASPFAIAVAPDMVTVEQGGNFATAVSVVRSPGFTGPVDITLDAPPAGFSAAPFTIPAGATAGVLNVATAALVTPGVTTPLTIKATSGMTSLNATLTTKVVGPRGGVDTTFGAGGTALIPVTSPSQPVTSAVQADGKIVSVVSAYTGGATNYDWVVLRMNADGTPDTTFGTNGRVIVAVTDGFDSPRMVGVLADGKIIVAGTGNGAVSIARLTTAGVLDATFGTAGIVSPAGLTNFDVRGGTTAGGKLVLVGNTAGDGFVTRFNTSDGAFDTTFNTTGILVSDLGGNENFTCASASTTTITVGGSKDGDMLAARYTNAGALDTTFATVGWKSVDFAGFQDFASALAIQGDGKVVLAGNAGVSGSLTKVGVARLTAAGALDTTFNTTGTIAVGGPSGDQGLTVALQADGKILAGGSALNSGGYDFYTFRLTAAGALDTTFHGTGKVYTDFQSNSESATNLFVAADGRITAVGYSDYPNYSVALVRYWP